MSRMKHRGLGSHCRGTMTKRNLHTRSGIQRSRSERAADSLRQLLRANRTALVPSARRLARQVDDAATLADCAERVSVVMPGGPLIRSILWARVIQVIAPNGQVNGSGQRLLSVCERVGVDVREARS